ncbi:hypothetical protein R3P38DRAFT_2839291 [Favolaschia claudopus]|uniref:Uncharacterized protein n=1 Tax=Favolaschia claudopus TaxID=2862362 RepID=A0AAW0DY67_9AGAR
MPLDIGYGYVYPSEFHNPHNLFGDPILLGDLSPCVQLEKSGCGKDDYNFAYVRWGVVVRTQANTVWLFNGREEHASVLPAASVMRNATSNGGHPTTSGTNVVRAQRVREIRCGYDLRTRVVHPRNVRR